MIHCKRMRRPVPMDVFVRETGRSARTIRRYVAMRRNDFLAQSIERAAPWRLQGVSRSTWYRRRRVFQRMDVMGHA